MHLVKHLSVLLILFAAEILGQTYRISVTNPSAFARKNETVEFVIKNVAVSAKSLPETTEKQYTAVVMDIKGKEICSQYIQYGDGNNTDVVVFQADFKPKEKKEFKIIVGKKSKSCDAITDSRFVLPREDYAWENDRIAFRMYGPALAKDVKNGIDVWTKRVSYPIVAKWYKESEGSAPGKDSYHIDKGEGADFFSVGKTLGAGSSALYVKDSLYQAGVFSRYKTITTGPIRTVFELYYDSVWIDGKIVKEKKRITLDAHTNFNMITCTYEIPTSINQESVDFVAGLVKRKNITSVYNTELSCLTAWGPVNDDTVNGYLGTAIIVAKQNSPVFKDTPPQYLIQGKFKKQSAYTYYAGAGWTRQGICKDEAEWKSVVEYYAKCKSEPLIIKLK